MKKEDLVVKHALIRIVGVFETTAKLNATIKRFKEVNYIEEVVNDDNSFLKNYWYPEFRDLYFYKKEKSSATILKKTSNDSINFIVRVDKTSGEQTILKAKIENIELFLFENNLDFIELF